MFATIEARLHYKGMWVHLDSQTQKIYTRREEVHDMTFSYMKPVNYLFTA